MEKTVAPSLFDNDGSFMEKFIQLQQEKDNGAAVKGSKLSTSSSGTSTLNPTVDKIALNPKLNKSGKDKPAAMSGKLAFSLKQKSKLAAVPVKLGGADDEDGVDIESGSGDGPAKRQKLSQTNTSEPPKDQGDVALPSPSDPAVKKVADKLASFVAKHGRQFEHVTRQRNPGNTPFKFLFDECCADYKYYGCRLAEEEKALAQTRGSQTSNSASTSGSASKSSYGSQGPVQQKSNYQIPASALYEVRDDAQSSFTHSSSAGGSCSYGESGAPSAADPIAMMEFYMKKAAQEERRRQPKQSKDEMPPPASLQASVKKGHHMGDYIPPEELEKFLASCNDAAAQKAAREAAEKAKIQADNVGHKLLSKMGWKEGEGLGSSRTGRAEPIVAGNIKSNNLGVGAEQPGEVNPEDDIYEQYKKRMMLGYRYRPNPLNNPRKAYY